MIIFIKNNVEFDFNMGVHELWCNLPGKFPERKAKANTVGGETDGITAFGKPRWTRSFSRSHRVEEIRRTHS